MASNLNPYLNFQDNARQAMEFYQGALGGELTLNTFGEFHASEDPAEADKIMHGLLKTPAGFTLMAADTPNQMQFSGHAGFSVSLSGDDAAELQGYWDALSEGGAGGDAARTADLGRHLRHGRGPVRRHVDGQHRRSVRNPAGGAPVTNG
ncbi:putative glyoxalase superfamily protein PhnB [Arthrobacter woluwensis]|nr:putative glyoxalase superfamily protein PhnB [Arthrobacter woluwensis]